MSMIEGLAITKPVVMLSDPTEHEPSNMVQPQRARPLPASDLPPMYLLSWLSFFGVLLTIAFYFILVSGFFVNGIQGFTFDAARVYASNGPDFPFSSPFYSRTMDVLGFFLIFPAILVSGTAGFLFPFCGMALGWMLSVRWRTFRWSTRLVWIALIMTTVAAYLVSTSPLGHSVLLWLGD